MHKAFSYTRSTLYTVPTGAPTSPMIVTGECNSINITWQAPIPSRQNGVITKYRLLYTDNDSIPMDQRTPIMITTDNCGRQSSTKIAGLTAQKEYFVSISAGNSIGFGPYVNISGYPSSRREYSALIITCLKFSPCSTFNHIHHYCWGTIHHNYSDTHSTIRNEWTDQVRNQNQSINSSKILSPVTTRLLWCDYQQDSFQPCVQTSSSLTPAVS